LTSVDDEEAVVHNACCDMEISYLSFYFEVSKNFESFLGHVFAVKVE
jgi:hypothetical protein